MTRDSWPELREISGKTRANGLDRSEVVWPAKVETIEQHLAQIDRGVDHLTYQVGELTRQHSELQERHRSLEEDLKRLMFAAIAATFALVGSLLLSRH